MQSEKQGLNIGSLFEETNLSYTQIVGILHHFAKETGIKKASTSLELTRKTVGKWYKVLSEDICTWWLRQPGNASRLGGIRNGRPIIVEIDESCVNKRKKGPIGRCRPAKWVFGGICPDQGIGFVVPVPNRRRITLEPEIIRHIKPGSLIVHDDWRAYDQISTLPVNPRYTDDTVVHKYEFVNARGRTTNHAERYWKEIKQRWNEFVKQKLTSHIYITVGHIHITVGEYFFV